MKALEFIYMYTVGLVVFMVCFFAKMIWDVLTVRLKD